MTDRKIQIKLTKTDPQEISKTLEKEIKTLTNEVNLGVKIAREGTDLSSFIVKPPFKEDEIKKIKESVVPSKILLAKTWPYFNLALPYVGEPRNWSKILKDLLNQDVKIMDIDLNSNNILKRSRIISKQNFFKTFEKLGTATKNQVSRDASKAAFFLLHYIHVVFDEVANRVEKKLREPYYYSLRAAEKVFLNAVIQNYEITGLKNYGFTSNGRAEAMKVGRAYTLASDFSNNEGKGFDILVDFIEQGYVKKDFHIGGSPSAENLVEIAVGIYNGPLMKNPNLDKIQVRLTEAPERVKQTQNVLKVLIGKDEDIGKELMNFNTVKNLETILNLTSLENNIKEVADKTGTTAHVLLTNTFRSWINYYKETLNKYKDFIKEQSPGVDKPAQIEEYQTKFTILRSRIRVFGYLITWFKNDFMRKLTDPKIKQKLSVATMPIHQSAVQETRQISRNIQTPTNKISTMPSLTTTPTTTNTLTPTPNTQTTSPMPTMFGDETQTQTQTASRPTDIWTPEGVKKSRTIETNKMAGQLEQVPGVYPSDEIKQVALYLWNYYGSGRANPAQQEYIRTFFKKYGVDVPSYGEQKYLELVKTVAPQHPKCMADSTWENNILTIPTNSKISASKFQGRFIYTLLNRVFNNSLLVLPVRVDKKISISSFVPFYSHRISYLIVNNLVKTNPDYDNIDNIFQSTYLMTTSKLWLDIYSGIKSKDVLDSRILLGNSCEDLGPDDWRALDINIIQNEISKGVFGRFLFGLLSNPYQFKTYMRETFDEPSKDDLSTLCGRANPIFLCTNVITRSYILDEITKKSYDMNSNSTSSATLTTTQLSNSKPKIEEAKKPSNNNSKKPPINNLHEDARAILDKQLDDKLLIECLEKELNRNELKLQNVPGDGDCGYHAIIGAFNDQGLDFNGTKLNKGESKQLRNILETLINDELSKDQKDRYFKLKKDTLNKILDRVKNDKWMEDDEIALIAAYTKTCIFVRVSAGGSITLYKDSNEINKCTNYILIQNDGTLSGGTHYQYYQLSNKLGDIDHCIQNKGTLKPFLPPGAVPSIGTIGSGRMSVIK